MTAYPAAMPKTPPETPPEPTGYHEVPVEPVGDYPERPYEQAKAPEES